MYHNSAWICNFGRRAETFVRRRIARRRRIQLVALGPVPPFPHPPSVRRTGARARKREREGARELV